MVPASIFPYYTSRAPRRQPFKTLLHLPHLLLELERAQDDDAQPDEQQRHHLLPEDRDADALQKDAADDDHEIPQGIEICEDLDDLRHVGDRICKP